MPAVSVTKSWDTLATATLEHYSEKLRDNIFTTTPFLDWMLSAGRVQKVGGGLKIAEHVMYRQSTTAMDFADYDLLDTTPQEVATMAFYDWRQYNVSIAISRGERNKNSGSKEQMLNLLQVKTKQAEMTFRDYLSTDIWAAQSGNKLDGIQTLLKTTASTVGGIDESANSWWAPVRVTSGATAANLKDKMRAMLNDLKVNKSEPDAIWTEDDVHEALEAQLEAAGLFELGKTNTGLSFGVKDIFYKGIPIKWDPDAPSTTMYFLNSEHLKFVVHPDGNFKAGPMITPADQHASVSHIYFMGNLVTGNRRAHGVISGITL